MVLKRYRISDITTVHILPWLYSGTPTYTNLSVSKLAITMNQKSVKSVIIMLLYNSSRIRTFYLSHLCFRGPNVC